MANKRPNTITLPVERTGLTVEEAAEGFLERDFSPNTRRNFQADLARFCDSVGSQPVASLEDVEIKGYLDTLENQRGGKISPATHNRHFGTLNNLFEWLLRQGEIGANPMKKLECKRVDERLPRPMTREQIETFFSRVKDLRERALFSLLYLSGLRIDEALSLDIEDVNLADATFRVLGKGGYERTGYLGEETRPLLRRYLRSRGNPKSGPLFASRQGRLSYHTVRILFKRYTEGLTVSDGRPLTMHQLRHTFGSERAGKIDAFVLRDLMGHRSIRTTLQYAKVNPERTREAFREFDRHETGKLPNCR